MILVGTGLHQHIVDIHYHACRMHSFFCHHPQAWQKSLVASARDQRNLQLTLDDCKRLFDEGLDRVDCFDKLINAFGTDEQKLQWQAGYFNP